MMDLLEAALLKDGEDRLAFNTLWSIARKDYEQLHRDTPGRSAYRRAIRALRIMVRAQPQDALAWANLGNTLRVGGDTAEALAAYDRAVSEAPYEPGIVSDRGLARSAAADVEGARADFLAAIELDEAERAPRQNIARLLMLEGAYGEAMPHLQRAARAARQQGRGDMTYRMLLGRAWRLAHLNVRPTK